MSDNFEKLVIHDSPERHVYLRLFTAKSRWELRKMAEKNNWRKETGCGADCTGQVFQKTCRLLRVYASNGEWVAVAECGVYNDV